MSMSAARLSGKYGARGQHRVVPIAEEAQEQEQEDPGHDGATAVLAAALPDHDHDPAHTELFGAHIELRPVRVGQSSSTLADLLPETISVIDQS
jgi:hypothetical protein